MEVCTNNGIEHGQILDAVAHSAKLNEDVFVITTSDCELVNEVIVTSEGDGHQDTIILNNSLSREFKTPAATPKMPQQSGPRNATHEDAAGLPVATPSFVIPPHLMGRNIENPAEDMIGSGRKLQKPRLGVRVPYRNLTSQIVTQDEIAQELLERSLKKHPVHDTPEGGDLFFAMKLTQRLANRLTPSATVVSGSSIGEMEATCSKSARYQQSSNSTLLPPSYAIVPQSTAIPDHGELLAILEDGHSGWVPEANSTIQERKTLLAEASKPPSLMQAGPSSENILVHSCPPKLDPLVEREMALKQLMELPIRTKKKKPSSVKEKTAKTSKIKEQTKKEASPTNKKVVKANNTSIVQGASNLANKNLTLEVGDASAKQKTALKRKLLDSDSVLSRRSYTVRKKEQANKQSPKEGNLNANSKTDVKRLKQTKIVEAFRRSAIVDKTNGVTLNSGSLDHNKIEVSSPKRKKMTSICNSKDITLLSDMNQETAALIEEQGLSVSTDLCDGKSDDDFPATNARKFATPPRTYSPRKRQQKLEETGSSKEIKINTVPQKNVNLSSITLPDSLQATPVSKCVNDIKVDDCLPTKTFENAVASAFSRDVVSALSCSSKNIVSNKKATATSEVPSNSSAILDATAKKRHSRRMGEIDRLLMDEGAINLLYEVEQRDSKRRSGLNVTAENGGITPQKKIRSPLKSVRRQKKDLLLKTRLVKNAVLRLSTVPTPPVAVALRLRRQIGLPKAQLSARPNQDNIPQPKKSVNTKESLRSPPPLTPVDPPSPTQTFAFPPRPHLPAEASRIIRRHSSSSTFSSRSTSPNLQNRNSVDLLQSPDNAENKPDNHYDNKNKVLLNSKISTDMDKKQPVARKKGVPIFVRKKEIQTYKGKKKKDRIDSFSESAERLLEIKCKELKIHKSQEVGKRANFKKSSTTSVQNSQRKASSTEKLKLKAQITRNVHKAIQKSKQSKLKKSGQESMLPKQKKKEEREKSLAVEKLNNKIPDLPSCLAAVATAFAAEGESLKRLTQLRRTSNDSSHSSSFGSRSSTSIQLPASVRKESKDVPPLSPNASSYSTLIKTLETESQKQKKKEGEETAKQRSSVRQNAGSYHYKDIWLRRYDNLVQIILAPASTKMKNALNIQVLRELREALQQLKRDDSCRVVLLTSAGSVFCQGIDFHCLLHSNADRRKTAAQELALALREFLKTLALFSKPIIAGVHGAAVGLGVTMLPFFDMVIASDKATFYTPYAKLGQVPEGAAILTLPHMLGNAVTSELLFGCRKLTASEALHFGLVTRILWPDRFLEELIPLIRSIANQSAQSMEATKALLRHNLRTKLDAALESEAHLLVQHWSSMECQSNFRRFLDDEDVGLQRQRLDP